MRTWFWMRRQKADSSLSKRELLNKLPSDGQNTAGYVADAEAAFETSRFGIRFRYEWEITPQPEADSYRVTENAFVSQAWYLLLAGSLIGICLGYIGFKDLSGLPALVSFFVTFALLGLFLILFIIVFRQEGPAADLFENGVNHTLFNPIASLLPIMPLPLLVFLAFKGWPQMLAFLVIIISLIVYGVWHRWVVEQSFRWQSWFVARMKQFPLIASNYVATLGFNSIILIILLITYNQPLFLAFTSNWPVIFPLLYGLMAVGLLEIYRRALFPAWRSEANRYRNRGRNVKQTRFVAATAIAVVGASIGFGYLSYQFLNAAVSYVRVFPTIGAYGLVLLYGIPIWYFAAGLIYQITRFFRGVKELFRRAEQQDLEHILNVDAETYVLDYNGVYAGAVTLQSDYILVSQGILDQLPEEQVAAIIAHEEGHLKHRDTALGLLLTVISPLLLTGRNVLYGVLDFRNREFQADQYAASRVNEPEQLYNALDALQQIKTEESAEDVPSVTPTLMALDSDGEKPSVKEHVFGFYFGEFAMSQVHPTLEERKKEL